MATAEEKTSRLLLKKSGMIPRHVSFGTPLVGGSRRPGLDDEAVRTGASFGKVPNQCGERGEMSGQPLVVGVEKRDPVMSGGADSRIAGGALALVALVDNAHVRVSERLDLRPAAVRRAVVDDNDFGGRVRLGDDRSERPGDLGLLVVQRDDDGKGLAVRCHVR